jgi:hypothetical protein
VQFVRRKLGLVMDLCFLPADRRPGFPKGTSHVVLMAKFIGHKWQIAAHAAFARNAVHIHRGGINGLIQLLRTIIQER